MAKMRSPNYPACALDDAVGLVKKFWAKEQNTPVPAEVAAKALGYLALSGPARTALASLKKYGLLSDEKQGMRVSQLALRILHPQNEDDRVAALQEAAMKPELFRDLSASHLNGSDDAIKSHLITKMDFSETGARTLIRSFRATMEFAKLTDSPYSPSDGTKSGEAMQQAIQVGKGEVRTAAGSKVLRGFSWPLSAETTARLEIVGNEELTSDHIDALTQYLEVAKKLLKPPRD
jgi:hypothetical protein